MGRALDDDQKLSDEIMQTCRSLQARAEASNLKFVAHLLGMVALQASKELANPGARQKMVGKTHTQRLLFRS